MTALEDAKVLLGVTGGIAAYKAASLARLLVGAGAQVDVVLTRGGARFIGSATFEGITGRPVHSEVWESIADDTHVALGRGAHVVVVYPATAHTLARMATGLADDLLTASLLVARCPTIVAPAMHTEMWTHPATQGHIATLKARGVTVLGPEDGPLMGGDQGPGRAVEPAVALVAATSALDIVRRRTSPSGSPDLAGRRILVTAGGTREAIDPVRFIGNRSSGKMGFAVAGAAAARGAVVTLVAAPSSLPTPAGVDRVDIESALEMHAVVMERAQQVDAVIKAAAVADYRPDEAATSKWKKDDGPPTLTLAANPDILADLGRWRDARRLPVLVGFAAETDDVMDNARAKIARKRVDLLVVNDVSRQDSGFDADTNEIALLWPDGRSQEVPAASKRHLADTILDQVATLIGEAGRPAD